MDRIKQDLVQRLQSKLGVSRRQIYRLVEHKVRQTHLERHLAAILVASENGINLSKYASRDDLAAIRGAMPPQKPAPTQPVQADAIVRKAVKRNVPIVLDLDFVCSEELRKILQRDIAELNAACSQGLEKTAKICMVLCGSIAEALLLDRLSGDSAASVKAACSLPANQRPKSPNDLEEWCLSDMLNVALRLTPPLLPEDAAAGAHQLRQWRNLIHPGRELRDERNKRIKPTKERAKNAIAYLEFIAEELGR